MTHKCNSQITSFLLLTDWKQMPSEYGRCTSAKSPKADAFYQNHITHKSVVYTKFVFDLYLFLIYTRCLKYQLLTNDKIRCRLKLLHGPQHFEQMINVFENPCCSNQIKAGDAQWETAFSSLLKKIQNNSHSILEFLRGWRMFEKIR